MVKADTAAVKKVKSDGDNSKQPNKYEKLLSKKRKLNVEENTNNKENEASNSEEKKAKKPRLDEKKPTVKTAKSKSEGNGELIKKKKMDPKAGVKSGNKFQNGNGLKKKFEGGGGFKKFDGKKNGAAAKGKNGGGEPVQLNRQEQKKLKLERKQKKQGEQFSINVNIKKIWETLRKAETTDETRRKLCTSLYDEVKGKIKQIAYAHDTCRVVECLIQYGNENHRSGVFGELQDEIVEMSKSKYARFIVKKMLTYGNKEQKSMITRSFTGKVTKLIKHSYACKLVESIFNEHASFAERNKMLLEFYDPTLAVLMDAKNIKSLSDILATNEVPKEKIMNNLKQTLTSCIEKTLLMFSIIHRVFLEYMSNCSADERAEMIDLLSENLVHMIHTKDGSQVAMECIWHSTAKQRKKIVKGMKSFVVKMAMDEYGHQVLEALFDSVDDTKLVQKGVLEEMLRSVNELFDNDYGRKVIAYLVTPRDPRFFLKDYVKRLETGDQSETSKKDPEKRRAELFEHSKTYLLEFISKEINAWLYNGGSGILVPLVLQKMGKEADSVMKKIADVLLRLAYKPGEKIEAEKKDPLGRVLPTREHIAEDATAHFVIKKLFHISKENTQTISLANALLSNPSSENMLSWAQCNRGCFLLVNLIETIDEANRKKAVELIKPVVDELDMSKPGAKLLKQKLTE